MGLGQVTLEAMEEEESCLEKQVQSNDGEMYHWGTHGDHDENEVEPRHVDKWIVVLCTKSALNHHNRLTLSNCDTQNAFSAPVNNIFHQWPSSGKIYKLRFVNNYKLLATVIYYFY